MPQKKSQLSLEKSLSKLEQIVEKLESGKLPLEDSLKLFEEGVGLTKDCQKTLSAAEKKIRILTENNTLVDFDEEDE